MHGHDDLRPATLQNNVSGHSTEKFVAQNDQNTFKNANDTNFDQSRRS